MALLTADDVLRKEFQATKFREGYDQDEVDEFLDEVVNTLRTVTGEKEELQAKLTAAEDRIAELEAGGAAVPAALPAEPAAAVEPTPEPEPEPEPEPVQAPVTEASDAPGAAGPQSAVGMLAMAEQLHDKYIEDGKAEAERLVAEAQSEGERIVREAEDKHERTIKQLDQERSMLERKIDELRTFERDYRTRLKSYLESLLHNVESGSGVSNSDGI